MSWEAWFTLGMTGLGIVALIREVLAPDLIFLGVLAILLTVGIVTPEEALVGFAKPGIVSIGAPVCCCRRLTTHRCAGIRGDMRIWSNQERAPLINATILESVTWA